MVQGTWLCGRIAHSPVMTRDLPRVLIVAGYSFVLTIN